MCKEMVKKNKFFKNKMMIIMIVINVKNKRKIIITKLKIKWKK